MILENTSQVKELLKDKFITFKNAAKHLHVDYEYLTKTVNGYEGYKSVITALTKAGITIVIQQTRKEAGLETPSNRKPRRTAA